MLLESLLRSGITTNHVDQPAPGCGCAASHVNLVGVNNLSGFDRSGEGGLFVFMGKNIPKPKAVTELTATLTQSDDRPASTKAFNPLVIQETRHYGTVILAVPSMKAALAAIECKQEFAVAIGGQVIFGLVGRRATKPAKH
jgi:hypothetical protein